MGLQGNIFLLLFGAMQGLLLTGLFIRRKTYRSGYVYLIIYLLVLIAQTLFKVADKYWLMQHAETMYGFSYDLPFLYGPLVWLFARNFFTDKRALSPADIFHFLPFVYCILVEVLIDRYSSLSWLYWLSTGLARLSFQLISIAIYHYYAIMVSQNGNVSGNTSTVSMLRYRWVRRFIFYSAAITAAISFLSFFIFKTYPTYMWLRYGFVLLPLFIYWISYSALNQPALFTVVKGYGENSINAAKLILHKPARKYANSRLQPNEASRIAEELQTLMSEKKVYIDSDLSIEVLASRVHTSRHILSQVLNEQLGLPFHDYVNSWRVTEAKQLLHDPERAEHKIAAIAYDAGFNSLSTFNDVFRKMTGQTPSQYRRTPLQNSKQQRV